MKDPKTGSASMADLPMQSLPAATLGAGFRLLGETRVIDLTTSIAGPYATMLLSDFGAEIVKVERPEGDEARRWGPPFLDGESLWFNSVNRNKKSVVIDAGTEAGREQLYALVRKADVVVTNQTPRVQRKLGLDEERLRALRPDLIFVSITGFGLSGKRSDLTCYDLIAEGYSGIMDVTGTSDGPAQKIGAPAADMLAGQDAAMATLAALFDRQRTGQGHTIEISLVESMTRFLACRVSSYMGSGDVPRRSGGTDSVIAIYQSFETADLPINLGLGSDAIWGRFWDVVGDPAYGKRAEFRTNADRQTHRDAIATRIQTILRSHRRDEWLAEFAKARVPAGPINRVDELVADVDLQQRGMFFTVEDDTGRRVPQVGLGIRFNGSATHARTLPPRLGQDTDTVLGKPPR